MRKTNQCVDRSQRAIEFAVFSVSTRYGWGPSLSPHAAVLGPVHGVYRSRRYWATARADQWDWVPTHAAVSSTVAAERPLSTSAIFHCLFCFPHRTFFIIACSFLRPMHLYFPMGLYHLNSVRFVFLFCFFPFLWLAKTLSVGVCGDVIYSKRSWHPEKLIKNGFIHMCKRIGWYTYVQNVSRYSSPSPRSASRRRANRQEAKRRTIYLAIIKWGRNAKGTTLPRVLDRGLRFEDTQVKKYFISNKLYYPVNKRL
jgi:hypothetical protein